MDNKTKLFETERLILRRFELADAEDMFKNYCSSENVTRYMTWNPHPSVEDTKAYLTNVVMPKYDEGAYVWAIVLKEINEVIGCIDINHYDTRKKHACFGWVIGEKFWGKGIMPEAATVIRDYMFSEGFVRLWAIHNTGNLKSGRVMQKIGMIHEGTLHKYAFDNQGELIDVELYAITK